MSASLGVPGGNPNTIQHMVESGTFGVPPFPVPLASGGAPELGTVPATSVATAIFSTSTSPAPSRGSLQWLRARSYAAHRKSALSNSG